MSANPLRRATAALIRYIFSPGVCCACGCELDGGGSICADCDLRLPRVPNPCQACAQPNAGGGGVCPACLLNPPRWQRMLAPFQYRGLAREYLLQLKFADATHLARTLGERGGTAFAEVDPRPDTLLPVPLHRARLLERGFNQADEIARVWSRLFDIPIDRRALARSRPTPSQSGLTAARRRTNVRNAFTYTPRRPYRHVALVDDVVTTGSTVDEVTRILHRGGVEFVEVWALARAYKI